MKTFGRTVFCLFITLAFDFVWLLGALTDWGENSPLEGSGLSGVRKLAIFVSFLNILVKIVLCFAGWRLAIVYRMKEVNSLNLPERRVGGNVKAVAPQQKKPKKKNTRPAITYSKKKTDSSLRFLDGGMI